MSPFVALLVLGLVVSVYPLCAQNPYLPLWEYTPDVEPHVFPHPTDAGRQALYVYGSHDTRRTAYCGFDQVLYWAPLDNLADWHYQGVLFESKNDANGHALNPDGNGDLLYAPDMAERTGGDGKPMYYFYPNTQADGRRSMVASSPHPYGPFTVCNWSKEQPNCTEGIMGFDPAVFVDDDGRVYGYWGFKESFGAELDPTTMATLKPGTEIVRDLVSNVDQDGDARFFEASSMRKVGDKYVLVFSRWSKDGDFGLYGTFYTLAYAYSDHPLGPFTYGGTLIDARGRDTDEQGRVIVTATPGGNTHGSICQINGRWWVFYHRMTGLDEFARQAMVAPIDVKVEPGRGGKVTITEAEYTSEGFCIEGLDPFCKIAAGTACHYTGPEPAVWEHPRFRYSGSYVQAVRRPDDANAKQPEFYNPVVNNTSGSIVGYKYLNMDQLHDVRKARLQVNLLPRGVEGTIKVMLGSPYASKGGKVIGRIPLRGNMPQVNTVVSAKLSNWKGMKGKQALYFLFESDTKGQSLCDINEFWFVK